MEYGIKKIVNNIKNLFPSLDELADTMDPLYAGEALAPSMESGVSVKQEARKEVDVPKYVIYCGLSALFHKKLR
ncbi:hypothetical protein Asulf_02127 [Archaeoglobus sulfaticallidus PM70-1]|uniref:Uncharacterized protein n=1 Tax=Archaeoglobus sulfaticallidus PM70-1 TaxID=387631 RepID=N0BGG1_9EURY|nr:hypothetical protein Asulf_02127 [Archaeoglobus sulfaticallidus PM70-1]